jgi:hypothetical protein
MRTARSSPRQRGQGSARVGACFLLALALHLAAAHRAYANEISAVYDATWAGLDAAEIRITLRDNNGAYRNEVEVSTLGLPYLLSHFRARAFSEGRLIAERNLAPSHYEAYYDLRKRRNQRLSMQFVARGGGVFADRGPEDTSRKPQLPQDMRRNIVDPLTAMTAIREELRRATRPSFTVPIYDGARRFDVEVHTLPSSYPGTKHFEMTLRPLAGFKGESSDDGDPDTAPRVVDVTMTDDPRLMMLAMTVPIFHMPLALRLSRQCAVGQPCPPPP